MALIELTSSVAIVPSRPAFAFNTLLIDDVLVDAGTRRAHRRMLHALRGRQPTAHGLTHAHANHQGSSDRLCPTLALPFWVPVGEVKEAESGDLRQLFPDNVITRLQRRWWVGPGHPVERALREGDAVGSFEVIETPGHSLDTCASGVRGTAC
jgi:hydroxyacylglutathione hydrolase